jgi:hypothetical protein
MKKIRIAMLLSALVFFGLVIYQNMGFLSTPASLKINFWVAGPFHTEKIINAQLILAAFFAGLLVSYFFGLSCRFKNNQTIKNLNETLTTLKNELSQYQETPSQPIPDPAEVSAEPT